VPERLGRRLVEAGQHGQLPVVAMADAGQVLRIRRSERCLAVSGLSGAENSPAQREDMHLPNDVSSCRMMRTEFLRGTRSKYGISGIKVGSANVEHDKNENVDCGHNDDWSAFMRCRDNGGHSAFR
jgi:hypothetical protein